MSEPNEYILFPRGTPQLERDSFKLKLKDHPMPSVSKLSIYTASKIDHASRWLELRMLWPEFDFLARWPDAIGKTEETPENAARFWREDLEDVLASDVVMVYGEPGETLRGALVEAGMGLARGKRLLLVGDSPSFGTWQFHPACYKVLTLELARARLGLWAEAKAKMGEW